MFLLKNFAFLMGKKTHQICTMKRSSKLAEKSFFAAIFHIKLPLTIFQEDV
jgi:hypothetical protein